MNFKSQHLFVDLYRHLKLLLGSQRDVSIGEDTQPDDITCIPSTHIVQGENWFLKVVFQLLHMYHGTCTHICMCTHIQINKNKCNFKQFKTSLGTCYDCDDFPLNEWSSMVTDFSECVMAPGRCTSNGHPIQGTFYSDRNGTGGCKGWGEFMLVNGRDCFSGQDVGGGEECSK